jgi:peptidoglycan hydrolase CwlO-like protein
VDIKEWTPIVVACITVVGGTGFWGWLQSRAKANHELQMVEAQNDTEFREGLKVEVRDLKAQVLRLQAEKEDLKREMTHLQAMADVQAKVAAQEATIKHLQDVMQIKRGDDDA